jgi:hypothetical protein
MRFGGRAAARRRRSSCIRSIRCACSNPRVVIDGRRCHCTLPKSLHVDERRPAVPLDPITRSRPGNGCARLAARATARVCRHALQQAVVVGVAAARLGL